MNSKIELINDYIAKCENCSSNDREKLVNEIVSIFKNDIKDITQGLDSYDQLHMWEELNGKSVILDYAGDVKLLSQKLIYYKVSLESELKQLKADTSPLVNVTQNNNVSIAVTFEQTINAIDALPNTVLSEDEKELLEGKLTKISTEKDKSKLWGKVQSVLKWIADKGIEVGIAALPYIAEALKNAK